MIKKFFLLITVLFFSVTLYAAESSELPVVIDADKVEFVQSTQQVVASGNVRMEYQDVKLSCDRAVYDALHNRAALSGNIKITRGETVAYGKDITYDFNAKDILATQMRMEYKPFYVCAHELERAGDERIIFKQGYVTTCDLDKPHYRLQASRVVVYPKKRIVAHNITVKVGDVPVLYFPVLSLPFLEDFPFILSFGKSDDWGSYLLTRYRYILNDQHKGKIFTDYYGDRGWGTGVSHKIETKDYGEALITYYSLQDKFYHERERKKLFEEYPDRSNIAAKYLEDDRYRAQVAYEWRPDQDNKIVAEYNRYSDKYFRKDFFYREYEDEAHPLSYILAQHSFDYSSLSFLSQQRANSFWGETEYKPQLQYDFFRQTLGWDKLYFESKSEAASLGLKYADSPIEDNNNRLHTYNQLSYVQRLGWLSITPYAGTYTTFYSRNRFGEQDILRVAPQFGTALSTKLYRTFSTNLNLFGNTIHEMRHIVTPEIAYNYRHSPTEIANNLYQFDGIDALGREHKVEFRLENKLQAKNDKRQWDLFYFAPSIDYMIDDEGEDSGFNLAKLEMEFYPKPGIAWEADSEYNCRDGWMKSVNTALTFSNPETKKYSFSVGHRYLRKESSQGTAGVMYQITPKFQFNGYWAYQYREREFDSQQYTLRTDLHCWWLDTGIKIDDDQDWTLWFAFTLKGFPQLHLGVDREYKGAKSEY